MAEPQPFLFVVPNPVFVSQCPILCMIAEKKQNQQTPKCLCLCSQPPVGQGFGYKRHWIKSSQWNGAKPWVGRGEGRDRDLVRCPQHHGALTGGSLAGDTTTPRGQGSASGSQGQHVPAGLGHRSIFCPAPCSPPPEWGRLIPSQPLQDRPAGRKEQEQDLLPALQAPGQESWGTAVTRG